MATKKAPKRPKKNDDSPATAAPDAGDAAISRLHDAGDRLLNERGEPGIPTSDVTRAEPVVAEADAAAAEEAGSALALAVQRAMRFSDKDHALVRLRPTMVEGVGPGGCVFSPAQLPDIPDGTIVDGRKLYRCLRAAGDGAKLSVIGGGSRLEIRFGSRRFTVATVPGAEVSMLPIPPDVAWVTFRPDVFRTALAFAGDEKQDKLAGVHAVLGGCVASDGRAAVAAFNATDASQIAITLPRSAFDGIEAPAVYLALTPQGHVVIGDPSTGEYRIVVGNGGAFPDVRALLERMIPTTTMHVTMNKSDLVATLKQLRIVQSAASSVKLTIWTSAPENGPAGDWIELQGGDPGDTCGMVARWPCVIQRRAPIGEPGYAGGAYKACFALDLLLKLTTLFAQDSVTFGVGATPRDPLTVDRPDVKVGMMPMVDAR